MKIEKLPSGSYRIRKMYNGKTYSVITDYKPTQKEALQLLAEELNKITVAKTRRTFLHAAEEYLKSKSNVLSPSTIKGYRSILRNLPSEFKDRVASDIENRDIQTFINNYSKKHSPKTVRNVYGFITAVLTSINPNTKFSVTTPQKIKKNIYIPTDEDVRKIFEYSKGTMFEVALMLAAMGLRRSEICALSINDLDGNLLTIQKDMVQDENNNWIIRTTKTEESTRQVYIPDYVADRIRELGYIYNGHPNSILIYLHKAQDRLAIPQFSLHKFRHYFATKLSYIPGLNEEDILKMGGWKTAHVMKDVYRHSMIENNKVVQKEITSRFSNDLFS